MKRRMDGRTQFSDDLVASLFELATTWGAKMSIYKDGRLWMRLMPQETKANA